MRLVGIFFIYMSKNLKSTQKNILFGNFFIKANQKRNSITLYH